MRIGGCGGIKIWLAFIVTIVHKIAKKKMKKNHRMIPECTLDANIFYYVKVPK